MKIVNLVKLILVFLCFFKFTESLTVKSSSKGISIKQAYIIMKCCKIEYGEYKIALKRKKCPEAEVEKKQCDWSRVRTKRSFDQDFFESELKQLGLYDKFKNMIGKGK